MGAELVPVGRFCPSCGGNVHSESWFQPALFIHGGYGATKKTTVDMCFDCSWAVKREVTETNPRG